MFYSLLIIATTLFNAWERASFAIVVIKINVNVCICVYVPWYDLSATDSRQAICASICRIHFYLSIIPQSLFCLVLIQVHAQQSFDNMSRACNPPLSISRAVVSILLITSSCLIQRSTQSKSSSSYLDYRVNS